MKSKKWLNWVLASSMAVAVTAVAQEEQETAKALGGSVTVGTVATDNRDSAADGFEEDNVDIYVQPKGVYSRKGETTLFELMLGPKYRYRTDPSAIQNEDEFHLDSSILLRETLSERTALRLYNYFNFTDDPEIEQGNAVLRRDSSYLMNRASAGLAHVLTETLATDLQISHMMKRYDDDTVADNSDIDRISADLKVSKFLDPTLSVLAAAGAEWNDSENSLDIERGFNSVYGAVGIEKGVTEKTAFSLMAGAQVADYEDDDIDSNAAPYIRVSANTMLTEQLSFYAQASHSITAAYSYPFSSQNQTSVFGRFNLKATPSLDLGLFVEYRIEDYDSDSTSDAIPDTAFPAARSGDETTVLAKASATYKIGDRTSVTLAHLIEDVDSDVYVTFTRNATSLALTREF